MCVCGWTEVFHLSMFDLIIKIHFVIIILPIKHAYICMCVCVKEKERETESERQRENVCVRVCML